eukprot:490320_1
MTEMNEMKEKYDSLKYVMEQTEEKSQMTTQEMQKLHDEKLEMEMQLKAMVNNDETVNELNDKIKILEQKLKDTQKDDNINMSSTQSNEIIEEIVEQTEINDDINNSVTNKSAVNEHNEQKLDIVADTMKETEIMDTTNKDDNNILNKMVIDMKENLNKIVNNCILQLDIATKVRKNCISLAEKAEALTDMSSFTVPYTKIKLSKDSECCDVAQAAIQLAFEGKIRCSIKLNAWKQMKNDKLIEIDSKNVTEKEWEQIVNNQVDEMINDIKRSML